MYKCVLTCIYTDVNTLIQMSMPMHIYMWKHADESTIIRMLIHIFMHAHDNTLIYIWVRLYESEICISKKYAHMLICIYLYMYEYASLYMCICTALHTFTFFFYTFYGYLETCLAGKAVPLAMQAENQVECVPVPCRRVECVAAPCRSLFFHRPPCFCSCLCPCRGFCTLP